MSLFTPLFQAYFTSSKKSEIQKFYQEIGCFTRFHQESLSASHLRQTLHVRSRKTQMSHTKAHLKLSFSQIIASNEGYAIFRNFNFTVNVASYLLR